MSSSCKSFCPTCFCGGRRSRSNSSSDGSTYFKAKTQEVVVSVPVAKKVTKPSSEPKPCSSSGLKTHGQQQPKNEEFEVPSIFKPIPVDSPALARVQNQDAGHDAVSEASSRSLSFLDAAEAREPLLPSDEEADDETPRISPDDHLLSREMHLERELSWSLSPPPVPHFPPPATDSGCESRGTSVLSSLPPRRDNPLNLSNGAQFEDFRYADSSANQSTCGGDGASSHSGSEAREISRCDFGTSFSTTRTSSFIFGDYLLGTWRLDKAVGPSSEDVTPVMYRRRMKSGMVGSSYNSVNQNDYTLDMVRHSLTEEKWLYPFDPEGDEDTPLLLTGQDYDHSGSSSEDGNGGSMLKRQMDAEDKMQRKKKAVTDEGELFLDSGTTGLLTFLFYTHKVMMTFVFAVKITNFYDHI